MYFGRCAGYPKLVCKGFGGLGVVGWGCWGILAAVLGCLGGSWSSLGINGAFLMNFLENLWGGWAQHVLSKISKTKTLKTSFLFF